MMSLLQRARESKATALAMYLVGKEAADAARIVPRVSIAATCAELGILRQQVYEDKARIEASLAAVAVAGRGRPRQGAVVDPHGEGGTGSLVMAELRISVLEFQCANPGAVVVHASGRAVYSDAFKRFVLDKSDVFVGTDEEFCRVTRLPLSTLTMWRQHDAKEPIVPAPARERAANWPTGAAPNELARTITNAYSVWGGKLSDFLRDAARRYGVAPTAIRSVLRIAGMLAVPAMKPPRYRGSTLKATPGAIVVTDGKEVAVELTASSLRRSYNWQGIVDQATTCHLGVVVTDYEDAAAVLAAYRGACDFLGKAPPALVHDQKPIHDDAALRAEIEAETAMIPATLGRPENKAVIEGEFGRWEREVGPIVLDDASKDTLVKSAVREVVRAYTSGINHAARAELDGKSRAEVVRDACPDPKKDAELVAALKAGHQKGPHPAAPLPTASVARALLDEAFERLAIMASDPGGRIRAWLADTFEPSAIRRALAIYEAKRAKGSLRGKHAHRYLVKLIREMQIEADLEREERFLLHYAETERRSWLAALVTAKEEIWRERETIEERILAIAEHALYGGIFLEKAYWESELMAALSEAPLLLDQVTTHIRRLYEVPPLCRRRLLNRLVTSQLGLERPVA
jgi:hypothetical protein